MGTPDDMVLAGSRPSNSSQNSPIDALHSRTCTVLIIDSVVISFLLYANFPQLGIGALFPGFFGLMVWNAYKSKSPWAYWFAPGIITLVSLFFLLILVVYLYAFFTSGNLSMIFMIIILAWASFSSIRFIRIHFHPVYKMGYSGYGIQEQGIEIHPNEMLAACPTCLAVLAINPLLLSPTDQCPHCDSPLVLNADEEE